jgi:hypothetical protein
MRRVLSSLPLLVLAACSSTPEPLPITPASEASSAAVARRPVPANTPSTPLATSSASATSAIVPVNVPAGTQYVCITNVAGERQQVAIEFAPKVRELCLKHPEMGPCQYEREACRRSGGRVFEANGKEITRSTENEYDKRVLRVTFKSN